MDTHLKYQAATAAPRQYDVKCNVVDASPRAFDEIADALYGLRGQALSMRDSVEAVHNRVFGPEPTDGSDDCPEYDDKSQVRRLLAIIRHVAEISRATDARLTDLRRP